MTKVLLAISLLLLSSTEASASNAPLSIPDSGLQEGIDFGTNGSIKCSYLHNEQVLRLQGYALKEKMHSVLQSHPHVKMLYIGNCGQLSKSDLGAISELEHLEYLKLSDVNLSHQQITEFITSLPASLLSLDLAGSELTHSGLITLCNAKCSRSLLRLAIRDINSPEALTDKSLSLLAGSRLSKRLQKLVMPLADFDDGELSITSFDDGNLNKRAAGFRDRVLCHYEDFYKDGRELYMLEDPSERSYKWNFEDDRWMLTKVHPVTGQTTAANSKSGSHKKPRDNKDQVRQDDEQLLADEDTNYVNDIQKAADRIKLLIARGLLTEDSQESWSGPGERVIEPTSDDANVIFFEDPRAKPQKVKRFMGH